MVGNISFGILMSVLIPAVAFSQSTRSTATAGDFDIRGKLIFPTTPPQERIEVNLERSMQRVQTVIADSVGNFEFRSVAPGDYVVIVRVPEFEDVNQSVNLLNTQRSTPVMIQMNPLFTRRISRPAGFEGDDPDVVDVKMMTKSYPKKAVQAYEKAIGEAKKGNQAAAVALLEEAVKVAPDFYHAQNNLGVNYMKLSRFAEAEAAYRVAATLNPKAQQPLLNLGILFITQAEARKPEDRDASGALLDKAMDVLDAAIKLKSNSAPAHFHLGTAYYKSGFYPEAEASLLRAHDIDPRMGNVRLMLVNVYIKQKRAREAIEQIDAFLKENPKADERSAMADLRAKLVRAAPPGNE